MTHLRDERPVERPEVENCSVTLVIDVSGSMNSLTPSGKSCIQEVNDGINRMIAELSNDGRLGSIVELSIITFSDKGSHQLYQGFSSIKEIAKLPPINLTTGTTTYAVDALEMAHENIRSRVKKYHGGHWKPWLVFITDGALHDDVAGIGQTIRQDEQKGKLRVLCFGVPGFVPEQLALLSDRVFQIVNYNFAEFFSWIAQSQAVVSTTPTGSNDPIQLPPTGAFTQISI